MLKRVTNLRPGGNLDPLSVFSGCQGITLDHSRAMLYAMWPVERALERPEPELKDSVLWDYFDTVREAVLDATSGTNFNPANHPLRLEHARVVFEAMNEEARVIRTAADNGHARSLKIFERLFEVHDFVCGVIEHSMEPCL